MEHANDDLNVQQAPPSMVVAPPSPRPPLPPRPFSTQASNNPNQYLIGGGAGNRHSTTTDITAAGAVFNQQQHHLKTPGTKLRGLKVDSAALPPPKPQRRTQAEIKAALREFKLQYGDTLDPNMDDKKLRRTISNRLSAQRSRDRQLEHIKVLANQMKICEEQIASLHPQIAMEKSKRMRLVEENAMLRQQMEIQSQMFNSGNILKKQQEAVIKQMKEYLGICKTDDSQPVDRSSILNQEMEIIEGEAMAANDDSQQPVDQSNILNQDMEIIEGEAMAANTDSQQPVDQSNILNQVMEIEGEAMATNSKAEPSSSKNYVDIDIFDDLLEDEFPEISALLEYWDFTDPS